MNISKTQGERKIKLEIDQIKEKIDGFTVKKSIKSQNNSYLNIYESFKPKFTESDGRSDWRELEMELGFRQEFKNRGRLDQLIYALIPNGVARFVIKNISPSTDRSYSSSLNGLDPEQMSERQRMKTFPGCCRHLECCFDSEPVYLQTCKHSKDTIK